MPLIANFLLFQIGWFACVLGAAHGIGWAGSALALLIATLHIALAERRRREWRLLLLAALIGFLWDSAVASAGFIRYAGNAWVPELAPHWMVALWVLFATTFNASLRWLRGRPLLAMALGAVGGPLAYLAGAQLGAISFPELASGLAVQAAGWTLLMPLLMRIADRLDRVSFHRPEGAPCLS